MYIIHGWDGSPDEPMLMWLKNELEKNNFSVIVPKMPNPEEPEIDPWVNKISEIVNPKEEVYFIGHSIGCQAVLRYIQTIDFSVKGVVLIAPWMNLDENTIEEEGEEVKEMAKPWMETPINWEKVKSRIVNQAVCIFSDNDPYVPLSEIDLFKEKLNAKTIIENDKGHFTSSDNITKNQTVVSEILKLK
jgi:hypothetical protein